MQAGLGAMLKLLLMGLAAGLLFSSTFVLNELMSAEGGHWLWSASLRYVFMVLFLIVVLAVSQGWSYVAETLRYFKRFWRFWLLAGGLGFGGFYGLLCFAADFSPGWVIAATWQMTVVASLFVFQLFGRTFPARIWFFSGMIFMGVVLINTASVNTFELSAVVLGGLPVLVAAFCYPLGNQLVWEAKRGHARLPDIGSPLLNNAFAKVLLLSLGSMPVWLVLIIGIQPPVPALGQILNTALVALLAGVMATSVFLFARNKAKSSSELAAVDATQSSEVVFALIGGVLFLDTAVPGIAAYLGIGLVFLGLGLFVRYTNVT